MVAGYVSLLYSIGDKPLEYWSKQQSQSGRIRKILDSDLLENVIEIQDFEQPNSYGTSILCPSDSSLFLNIELPILVVVIKNVNLPCRLQLQVADTQNCQHHFQFTNVEGEKQNSRGLICRAKLKLETGWNKLELNLSSLTQTIFKSEYAITQRIQISGNCRLRRVYFIDKHYDQQEICPKLYHRFLDSYMLKWGIHTVERSSQTSNKRNKSKIKAGNNLKSNIKHSSAENVSEDEIGRSIFRCPAGRSRMLDENFLKNLQMKTNVLINSFFDRQPSKLPHVLELKQNAKLKPYALPASTANVRIPNPSNIADEARRRINVLRTFTDNQRIKDKNAVKNIQDNWRHRYFLPHDKSLKSNDATKQNLKRTMLECKPKSLHFLAEVKPDAGRSTSESSKTSGDTSKRNENDAT
nr:PREDICTED: uncharacterized protein LOC105663102 [Megachile rotundata]